MSRPSMIKHSHAVLAELFARVRGITETLAKPFGINPKTVGAWARPVSSNENPFGSGNGNPLDRVDKLLQIAHVYDPEKAREIAQRFVHLVDELDRQAGIEEADEQGNPCKVLANVSEQHLKIVKTLLGDCENPSKLSEAYDHTLKLNSFVIQLQSCIEQTLKNGNQK